MLFITILTHFITILTVKNITFQFQFVVQRGNNRKGYVAIDDVEFRFIELCEFSPPDAKPVPTTVPPPTTKEPTTVPPTTTKAPTTPTTTKAPTTSLTTTIDLRNN